MIALLLACSGPSLDGVAVPALHATISGPADGAVLPASTLELLGEVVHDGAALAGWSVGEAIACANVVPIDGSVSCEIDVEAGEYTVVLDVRDEMGRHVFDRVQITVDPDAPPALTVSLPAAPTTLDALVATVVAGGLEEDEGLEGSGLTLDYAWTVDGVASTASTSAALPASETSRGEVWSVEVNWSDGVGDPASAETTIVNSPPGAPVISITPAAPEEGESLACEIVTAATDADEDPVTYATTWSVDGAVAEGAPTTTAGETWTCTVTPSDDAAAGTPAAASVVISAPSGGDTGDTGAPLCETLTFEMQGVESDDMGGATWNADGSGPEAAATGHDLSAIHSAFSGYTAYYYVAGRDHVNASGVASMKIVDGRALTATQKALTAHGYAEEDITLRHDVADLGGDVEGVDWVVHGMVETRWYRGATYHMLLSGEEILEMADVELEVVIDYGSPSDTSDDVLSGSTNQAAPADVSTSAAGAAVAAALLADLDGRSFYLTVTDLQTPAISTGLSGDGRSGAYFDNTAVTATAECE